MRLTNHTPFPALAFESLAPDGSAFTTLVVKATFDIRPDATLRLADEQIPLTLADEYYGDPLTSSVRLESDLAPFKPRTDIVFVDPVACAPEGRPAEGWTVSIRLGELQHQLRVTGPRLWRPGLVYGWSLSEPAPATKVPIRWEHAYGGQWAKEGQGDVCQENPVGRGVLAPADRGKDIPAPQVEGTASPVRSPESLHTTRRAYACWPCVAAEARVRWDV